MAGEYRTAVEALEARLEEAESRAAAFAADAERARTELAEAKEALAEVNGPRGNPEGFTIPELLEKIKELDEALEEVAAQPGTFLGVDFADLSEYLPYSGPSLQDVESFKESVRAWAKAEGHPRLALEVG